MSQAMIMPKKYFFDKDGEPLAYGKVYTYQAGTTTDKASYTSEAGGVENTNPIILNGEGYASIYLDGSYNIVVDDQNDNVVWTEDPVSSTTTFEWVNCLTPTYISLNSFKVTGDVTEFYDIGRRVRIDNNVASYSYSSILTSVFAAGKTTITVTTPVVAAGIIGVCSSVVGKESVVPLDFDSIATMKATDLVPGVDAKTASYYAGWAATINGPSGGADYSIVTKAEHDTMRGVSTVDEKGDHTLSNGNVALLQIGSVIYLNQFGALGDFDVDAMIATPSSNTGTVDTLAIQAALDAAENNFDPYDINPSTTTINLRNIFGGGRVVGENGKNYKVDDTLTYAPRVTLDLKGGSLIPDNSVSWPDETGPILDWIEVTNGGSGYTTEPTITITGGGGTGATAKAVMSGGIVIAAYVLKNGQDFTSVPTIGFTGGGGAGATATAELGVIGKPIFKNKPPAGTFTTSGGGLINATVFCRGISDGLRLEAVRNPDFSNTRIHDAKHNGSNWVGCDRSDIYDLMTFAAGRYNTYVTGNWSLSPPLPTNEVRFFGGHSSYGGKACIRTDSWSNSCNWRGVTVRQRVGDIVNGVEFLLSAQNTGHELRGVKIEHDANNSLASIVTLNGDGFNLDFNAAPNTPLVHYKWVQNFGATDIVVAMHSGADVINARVDNPNLVNDISPFESHKNAGLRIKHYPQTSNAKLDSIFDWCRDLEGNNQTGSKVSGMVPNGGLDGNKLLSSGMELEQSASINKLLLAYVSGDTVARMQLLASGAFQWGSGSAAVDTFLSRTSAGLLGIDSGTNVGTVQAMVLATTTELEDIADAINTEGKFNGRMVKNSTTNVILWASTSADSGAWRAADGTITHTPI